MSNVTREVTIKIVGNTDQFIRKMGPAGEVVREFATELSGAYETIDKLSKRAGSVMQRMGVGIIGAMGATIAQAGRWEQSFADVAKTMQGTDVEVKQVGVDLRELSRQIPVSAGELARLGSIAGQLGIRADDVGKFVDVAAKLGVATELSSSQAITSLSRLINITGEARANLENVASSLVHLGNVSNTSEGPILDFAMRIAGTASVAGVASQEVLGIASSFTAAGVEAEAGGTAVQKVILDMVSAARTGSSQLTAYARILGLTREQMQAMIQDDPTEAVVRFSDALQRAGSGAEEIFNQLGMNEVRLKRAFLSVAGSTQSMRQSVENANRGFEENNALTKEAETRFKTLFQETVRFKNVMADIPRALGAPFLKPLASIVRMAGNVIDVFNQLPESIKGFIGVLTIGSGAALFFGGTLAKLALALFSFNGLANITLRMKEWAQTLSMSAIAQSALTGQLTTGQRAALAMRNRFEALTFTMKGYATSLNMASAAEAVALAKDRGKLAGMGLGLRDIRRGYVAEELGRYAYPAPDDRFGMRRMQRPTRRLARRVVDRINTASQGGAMMIPPGWSDQTIKETAKATQALSGYRLAMLRVAGTARLMGALGASSIELIGVALRRVTMLAGVFIKSLVFSPMGLILLGTVALPAIIKRFKEMGRAGAESVDSVNEAAKRLAETMRFDRNEFGELAPTKEDTSLFDFMQGNANLIDMMKQAGSSEAALFPVLVDLKLRGASDEQLSEIVENLKAADALPDDFRFDVEIFTNFAGVGSDDALTDVRRLAEMQAAEIERVAEGYRARGARRVGGWWDLPDQLTGGAEELLALAPGIGDITGTRTSREQEARVQEMVRSVGELSATRFQAAVNAPSSSAGLGQIAAIASELNTVAGADLGGIGADPLRGFLDQLDPEGEFGLLNDYVAGATTSFETLATAVQKVGGAGMIAEFAEIAAELEISGDQGERLVTIFRQLASGELSLRDIVDASEDLSERFGVVRMAGERYYHLLQTLGEEAAQSFVMQQFEVEKANLSISQQRDLWADVWMQVRGTNEEFEAMGQAARQFLMADLDRILGRARQGIDMSMSGLNPVGQIRQLEQVRQITQSQFGPNSDRARAIREEQEKIFFDLGGMIIQQEQQRRQILLQQEHAAEDAAISFERQLRNIRRSQERALRDYRRGLMTALDPGDRFAGFRGKTLPTESLIRNLELQNERFAGLTRDLGRLRTMGLSEDVIRTLDLTNPQNIQQVTKIVGDSVQDPRFIGALNAAVKGRVDIIGAFTSDMRNAPDLMEQFNDQVADATQNYKDQLADMARDNARELARMGQDFEAFSVTLEDAMKGLGGMGNVYIDGILSSFIAMSEMLGLPTDTEGLMGLLRNPAIEEIIRMLGLAPLPGAGDRDPRPSPGGGSVFGTGTSGEWQVPMAPPPDPSGWSPIFTTPVENPEVWEPAMPTYDHTGPGGRQPSSFYQQPVTTSQSYETNHNYTGDISVQANDPAEFQRQMERKQRQQRLTGYLENA